MKRTGNRFPDTGAVFKQVYQSPYFNDREKRLREVGLDPDDDEDWARPDYDLDVPIGERVEHDDGWLFGSAPEPYDSSLIAWCRDCYEVEAAKDDILCTLCRFDHDRKVA